MSCIKSFPVAESKKKKLSQAYGIHIAMGIGDMRIVDKEHDIMDGEAVYLSGRILSGMRAPNKNGTSMIESADKHLKQALQTDGTTIISILIIHNERINRYGTGIRTGRSPDSHISVSRE